MSSSSSVASTAKAIITTTIGRSRYNNNNYYCYNNIRRQSSRRYMTTKTTSSSSSSHSSSTSATTEAAAEAAQRRAYEHYYKKQRFDFGSHSSRSSVHERNVQVAWYAAAAVVGALGATYASVPLYKLFCQVTGFGGTTQRVELTTTSSTTTTRKQATPQQQQQQTNDDDDDDSSNNSNTFISSKLWQTLVPSATNSTGIRVHTWTDEEAAQRLASLQPVQNGRLVTVRFDSTVGDVLPWTFEPVQLNVKVVPGETALAFFRVTNHHPTKALTGVATYNVHPPKAGLYFTKIQCFCFEQQRLLPNETVDMPVFFFIDPDFLDDAQLQHVHNITLSYTFFPTTDDDDDEDEDEMVDSEDDVNDEEEKRV